jgi:hypothetical protein
MINLLSPQEKLFLEQEERSRLLSTLLIIFLLSLISFVLIMLSIKFYISGELEAQKIILSERQIERSYLESVAENIEYQNDYLSQIKSFYKNDSIFSGIISEVSQSLPSEIYLTKLNISSVIEKASKKNTSDEKYLLVSLAGFSPTRDIVLEVKDNLEKHDNFKEIYFPTSNWIKPDNVEFSVDFKVEFK